MEWTNMYLPSPSHPDVKNMNMSCPHFLQRCTFRAQSRYDSNLNWALRTPILRACPVTYPKFSIKVKSQSTATRTAFTPHGYIVPLIRYSLYSYPHSCMNQIHHIANSPRKKWTHDSRPVWTHTRPPSPLEQEKTPGRYAHSINP